VLLKGPITWSSSWDEEGHRTYKVKWLCYGSTNEGPARASECPGLPLPGSFWFLGVDLDEWAWCRATRSVTPLVSDGDPNVWWIVEQEFSTKPPNRKQQRCQDVKVEDPLLEPPKLSGSTTKYQQEAVLDAAGQPIVTSAGEPIRGPQAEFDETRYSIRIEQNVPTPDLAINIPYQLKDCINSTPLWGFPARCVKLTKTDWVRQFWGACEVYYKRTLEFDVWLILDQDSTSPTYQQYVSGFDRTLVDEGSLMLRGRWDTDPNSPSYHQYLVDADVKTWAALQTFLPDGSGLQPGPFGAPLPPASMLVRYKDFTGENAKGPLCGRAKTILGAPLYSLGFPSGGFGLDVNGNPTPPPGKIKVKKYIAADLTQLSIPTVLQ
jgi:hypothetical protein